ncbi:MAG: PIN domain nuclease [Candidatus Omnitrophica bacterium CG_4_10_14_0_8_um_filter_43_18]|nr:MAG: PIN domain nuclease [Candidatus Omnitrophica bacterium CG_4_10_14_0_8_um_filter_43_18]PJC46932.1 MAG: PIN domain nuclease [Candidatus Omnitrophica bacterium CG_4_9_14_0_2_um_filter_43_12]
MLIVRILFMMLCALIGYRIGYPFIGGGIRTDVLSAGIGVIIAFIVIILEMQLRKISVKDISSAVFGIIFGLIVANLLTSAILLVPSSGKFVSSIRLILTLICCYLGAIIVARSREEFNAIIPYIKFTSQDQKEDITVIDTSVIIDGRIADLCQTKFLPGKLVIPRFVLKELQQIADSADSLKRNRGRRGLDILNKIKKAKSADLKISDEDFPEIREVDSKIVKLAKMLNASVFTNDYNLNKIAELQGVTVLNINDLTNALKVVVLPGELLQIRLIKEGKEHNQAIGYLEDGTMVVVDNAKHLIGQAFNVEVTSALQTSAGRMIFAKITHERKR